MFRFLMTGLLRDRSRSLVPLLIVSAGVAATVFMISYMQGFLIDFLYENARFATGHVKIVTRSYGEMLDQKPLDLALLGVDDILREVKDVEGNGDILWTPRIYFGGLIDIPDENGETQFQGEGAGMAVALVPREDGRFDPALERELLRLDDALVQGRLPVTTGEMLVSEEVFGRLGVPLGHTGSIITSTMNGAMEVANFNIVGTVTFGVEALDRGGFIIDFTDAQQMLDMEDGAGEILGFFPGMKYDSRRAETLKAGFNAALSNPDDEFSPYMFTEYEQNDVGASLAWSRYSLGVMMFMFVAVMVIVLWNAGLMQGIRRYGEIGVRLALGESKGHVYRAMILESLAIGVTGGIVGTAAGLVFSYWLQYHGFDMSHYMTNSSILMSTVMHAHVNLRSYLVGFIPGIVATVLGAVMAGVGVYKRQTSQLFKELEA